ncbi:MAG: hypothetical protein HN736_05260 [Anaerolineae bacterium]|jgi:hypothetical protein|nr:hypothetical protein [Anaerolineae bacterium]MBT3713786.1 hypothetical protein [Anaerolineae bacterium]MBT4312562.1 hypothetical protein [Anaerolineae bacterium]MBT4457685.1 hypothetical protein [Anaerolineae bacterium]MBT4841180.1 hypothetical protein [Anaerolineae bacterium]
MNAIADQYADQGVGSIFLYTHEAHPGENYPHLTSMEQKTRNAHDLRDVLGVTRPILIDALDGACHRTYGSMPNMTWIFNRAGIPIYKSDWSDAASVENALIYFLNVGERRKSRERLAPFHVERLDYRSQDREAFYNGLERSGQKAVDEFRKAFG